MAEACAELDAAEAAAWDRPGGPSNQDDRTIRALEREIGQRPAESVEVALWRAKRLARAVLNGWHEGLIEPLAAAVERDWRALSSPSAYSAQHPDRPGSGGRSLKPVCSWGPLTFVGADEVTDGEGWCFAIDWIGLHLQIGGGRLTAAERDLVAAF